MKNIWKLIVPLFISVGLSGCLFDSRVLWEDEQYHVAWIDTNDNRHLYYTLDNGNGVGKIDDIITAVGSNDLYVVAKTDQNRYYYIIKSKTHPYPGGGMLPVAPMTSTNSQPV